MASVDINTLGWPMSQLGEAMHALASERGIAANNSDTFNPPGAILCRRHRSPQQLREWVEARRLSRVRSRRLKRPTAKSKF
jgi:hypothetical protein